MKLFEEKLRDSYGDTWTCAALLNEDETSICVVCRKYADFNTVDCIIPVKRDLLGTPELAFKIIEEAARIIG